jgi:hypothetical protein
MVFCARYSDDCPGLPEGLKGLEIARGSDFAKLPKSGPYILLIRWELPPSQDENAEV